MRLFTPLRCNCRLLGCTDEDDGTGGLQPRASRVTRNYVREIGILQKQSSAWFQAKSCLNSVASNVLFNGPRAAINFNDGFGGGTNVSANAIFNECRETSDHGPINSWDRQPFLTEVAHGTPSYDAAMNSVDHNLIISNYGSSQGFDTDDGSSWYDIHHNFFFDADGWKMDYGGHDSKCVHAVGRRAPPLLSDSSSKPPLLPTRRTPPSFLNP